MSTRRVLIIAGPNGAGESTLAGNTCPTRRNVRSSSTPDLIAAGLSPFDPAKVAMRAGRLMLQEIERHVATMSSFAFETTLSGLI